MTNLDDKTSDYLGIKKLLNNFEKSISGKNKGDFLNLFYSNEVIWLAVVSDADLVEYKKKDPKQLKVNDHNHIDFINWVVSDPEPKQVKFSNVNIQADGNVASIYCDYAFYLNGDKTNSGKETFTLVCTSQGWRISGIAFSRISANGS